MKPLSEGHRIRIPTIGNAAESYSTLFWRLQSQISHCWKCFRIRFPWVGNAAESDSPRFSTLGKAAESCFQFVGNAVKSVKYSVVGNSVESESNCWKCCRVRLPAVGNAAESDLTVRYTTESDLILWGMLQNQIANCWKSDLSQIPNYWNCCRDKFSHCWEYCRVWILKSRHRWWYVQASFVPEIWRFRGVKTDIV